MNPWNSKRSYKGMKWPRQVSMNWNWNLLIYYISQGLGALWLVDLVIHILKCGPLTTWCSFQLGSVPKICNKYLPNIVFSVRTVFTVSYETLVYGSRASHSGYSLGGKNAVCILGIHSNFLLIKQNSSAFLEIFFNNYQKIVFSCAWNCCIHFVVPILPRWALLPFACC